MMKKTGIMLTILTHQRKTGLPAKYAAGFGDKPF